jgi:hypothetical protein
LGGRLFRKKHGWTVDRIKDIWLEYTLAVGSKAEKIDTPTQRIIDGMRVFFFFFFVVLGFEYRASHLLGKHCTT